MRHHAALKRFSKLHSLSFSLNCSAHNLFLLLFLLFHMSDLVHASWWLLGTDRYVYTTSQHKHSQSTHHSSTSSQQHSIKHQHQHHLQQDQLPLMSDIDPEVIHKSNHCTSFPYFVERQKNICKKSSRVFPTIIAGARLGIQECQFQLQSYRWNCSIIHEANNVFGEVLAIQSREKAYVHAISSASLAYEITKACARGELDDCACDEKVRGRNTKGNWQWGGCSEDIRYGTLFSKEFVDAVETKDTSEGLMNLHNNEAGRRILKTSMNISCKCHGVSGSCTMKVCWRVLPSFRSIGEKMLEKFEGAFHVKPSPETILTKKLTTEIPQQQQHHHNHHQHKHHPNELGIKFRLKPIYKQMKKPTKRDLVFIDESPDYCDQNSTLNVLGTKGRVCNRTSNNADSCKILCCGRGYQTMIKEGVEKCNCQFVWCCKVKCELCPYKRDEFVCN